MTGLTLSNLESGQIGHSENFFYFFMGALFVRFVYAEACIIQIKKLLTFLSDQLLL